jgi:hypothetical protein
MTFKQAAEALTCVYPHVHALINRGRLTRVSLHEVSDESVAAYARVRRLRRKTLDTGFISAKHVPVELLRRFRSAVPGGSSLVACLIEAMELWLKEKENK